VTEDDVRRLALSLPATAEKPSYGTPGFRVKDKLFARVRDEGDGHPTVLVRFAAVDQDEMRELLTESWRIRAPKKLVQAFDAESDQDTGS
jgi:hypothetical protein